jgi:hypothetical protein
MSKSRNIINWVLAGLVGFIFIGSAMNKFMSPDAAKIASDFGISAGDFTLIAIVEIISIVLFLVPRTGVLGSLLLVAYMGGAIATHLEHGQSILAPVVISAIVWVAAVVRFPELTQRIVGKTEA